MSKRVPILVIFLFLFSTPVYSQQVLKPDQQAVEAGQGNSAAEDSGEPERLPEKLQDKRSWKFTRGAKAFEAEFGFAPMQPTFFAKKEYDTGGRKFATTSLRFGKVIGTAKGITYEYLFEVIPFSLALNNEVENPARAGGESRSDAAKTPKTLRKTTYGIGIQPVGFRFVFMPHQRLKPYAQTGAGFLFSNKPIPVPGSTTYNFIGDFGGGVMLSVSRTRTINVGYRYFHISNMNIGEINPGYNANIFYIGYSLFNK